MIKESYSLHTLIQAEQKGAHYFGFNIVNLIQHIMENRLRQAGGPVHIPQCIRYIDILTFSV